ncbi:hypothetical protein N9L75_03700 [Porticoccaceae bacterium]|nr:hypothetical protein [Porticoccaceae bacterium]MDA8651660.1 hypothetical protein [Porticoccaceae bacterium]MDA8682940.1 hypothetical protein [Porticoccaceae bacterium]MDB2664466.1 hypothetical protein [Porticoccaceae bacterium]
MLVTRSTSDFEPDLLQGAKGVFCFKLLGEEGETLRSWGDASSVWSHEQLDSFLDELVEDGLSCDGWDAFVGDLWVGSSEV